MSLVLYSGGDYADNEALNRICLEWAGVTKPKITYIPSSCDLGLDDFEEFMRAFLSLNASADFVYFPIDVPFTDELLERAFESDIIFLSGGNTFYFLKHLREKKILPTLKKLHRGGRVIAGMSAGAILLTPSITTASFPAFDRDENRVGLKDLRAGKFVGLEFFPHFEKSARYEKAMRTRSLQSSYPLWAQPDGAGLAVSQTELRVIGPAYIFDKGKLKPSGSLLIDKSTPELIKFAQRKINYRK